MAGWWGNWESAWERTYWKRIALGPYMIAHLRGATTVAGILTAVGGLTSIQQHALFGYLTYFPIGGYHSPRFRNLRVR